MSKINVFTPPSLWDNEKLCVLGNCAVKIFLGGSIDMGTSDDWHKDLITAMSNISLSRPVSIYNPRRDEWPSSDDHREISKQIEWELYHLEKADLIVMNILADSKSPISLMELGLFAKEGKLMVFCPKTFYRYDNVMMVCKRYDIPLFTTNNIPYIAEKVCNYIGIDEKETLEKEYGEKLL